jgi:hypothetical protein
MVNSERIISEKAEKVLSCQYWWLVHAVNSPEDTVSVSLEGSETGSSGKVSSLHNTTRDEHPMNQHDFQTRGDTYSG